ncbi:MAG: hypothetical protein ACRC6V_12135 [Bacteroidales bacterium]
MTKVSKGQVLDAILLEHEDEFEILEDEVDHEALRTSFQRKEIRTKRKREDGEVVGKGSIHKHRKF